MINDIWIDLPCGRSKIAMDTCPFSLMIYLLNLVRMLIAQIATYKNQRVRELSGIQTRLGYSIYIAIHMYLLMTMIQIWMFTCSNLKNTLQYFSDTLKLRMRFWKRRAAKKSLQNTKKWQERLFSPFCQSGHLSNGDLRMCGH